MREQWVGIEYGDEFTVAEDQDGYPGVRIDNRVWAGEEDRWITSSMTGADGQRIIRALGKALFDMADAMGTPCQHCGSAACGGRYLC